MRFLKIFLYLALITCGLSCQRDKKESPPNVLIILSDDQGWGDLSLSSNSNLSTPNLDALGRNGAVFQRFYVCPVCSPTRAELLTGRYFARSGVFGTSAGGERMDLDEKTMADIFRENGYRTALFGKWHSGMQYPYHPNGRGFDEFYGFCSGHWGDYFSPDLERNGKLVKGEGFLADDLTNHAIDFMEQFSHTPFLLFLSLNTPHSPMQVPDLYWNRFEDKEMKLTGTDPAKENLNHTRAALAMCENIDWNVGRVIDKLAEKKLLENTIVLYFSDNGPNGHRWNGGMKGIKGSTDEGGIRSPLLINWKGKIEPGTEIKDVTSVRDLLPTLCDMAGVESHSPIQLDGRSFKSLIFNDPIAPEERYFFNHWSGRTSVRYREYLMDHLGAIYDIENDPAQMKDLSDQFPEMKNRLIVEKDRWEQTVLAEIPEGNIRPYPVGHPDFIYTQLPARDAVPHGGIRRSNQYPNSSYLTNWTALTDSITWNIEVVAEGTFDVDLYYTCAREDTGSVVELSFGDQKISGKIREYHDPPERGMENDRFPRIESYVKDFKKWELGSIKLQPGTGPLLLRASEIKGKKVMDLRLLMFTRKQTI